jgi:probable F420-dependent oxidoreductase
MTSIDGLDLGTFGIYTFDFEGQPAAQMRESIQELEEQGWPSFWFPELLGREALTHAGFLLASTERMRVVNAIALVWPRDAQATYGGSLLLADAYPNRHLLGLGFGGHSRPGTTPLTAIAGFLDELEAMDTPNPLPAAPMHRILAAYGPKMIALARDRTAGSISYKVNVAHTAQAREILGPDKFLAVEHAVLLEPDSRKARAIAREHLDPYLNGEFNVAKFRRLGYTEADLANGGSDPFVDDFVFWGDPDAIVDKLTGHIEAGADHVAVHLIGIDDGQSAMAQWRTLADALVPGRAAV